MIAKLIESSHSISVFDNIILDKDKFEFPHKHLELVFSSLSDLNI